MDSKAWIEEWFKNCTAFEVKPWEWDFKQSYIESPIPKDRSRIALLLEYKSNQLTEIGISNSTGNTRSKADCDKEAYPVYRSLWGLDDYKVIRGETMNSFITTFHHGIFESKNKDIVYRSIGISEKKYFTDQYDKLIADDNFKKFEIIQRHITELEKFAALTHCIGNFTILPHWMNTGRYLFSQDYWDITLQSFSDFLRPLEAWEKFVDLYDMQPYVNNDQEWTADEFWEDHFSNIGGHHQKMKPQTAKQFDEYLNKVNIRIEERGRWMVKKICEKLSLTHFEFYQEIKDMQIRFSNEIMDK
ncbi:hypothetical protein [Saccharibacillus alkalitolerans]|uniref:Aminoglycoside phosphotransferase domain-containing protein n=1 Tax=Saccharibacillus alkalitolerans TaxID=2705290 RepID=A0ABX0FAR6_9BACL|nr:hypothetical protein [Saccharibacillus alkalitolerans]NGZ77495.1 hypothetical protein [Saccharibacillus alkalitolerans]